MKERSLFGLMVSLAFLGIGFPSKAASEVITRQSGSVKAEISYLKDGFKLRNLRLKIVRSGRTLLDQPVAMKSAI